MEGLILQEELSQAILGTLHPEEALRMMYLCRCSRDVMEPYRSALAFALTRPRLQTGSLNQVWCVQRWAECWFEFAQVADSEGWNRDVLAHSLTILHEPACNHAPPSVLIPLLRLALNLARTHGHRLSSNQPVLKLTDISHILVVEAQFGNSDYYAEHCSQRPTSFHIYGIFVMEDGRLVTIETSAWSDPPEEHLDLINFTYEAFITDTLVEAFMVRKMWEPSVASDGRLSAMWHSCGFQFPAPSPSIVIRGSTDVGSDSDSDPHWEPHGPRKELEEAIMVSRSLGQERRMAWDGYAYTFSEFKEWYGLRDAKSFWAHATSKDLTEFEGRLASALCSKQLPRLSQEPVVAVRHDSTDAISVIQYVEHDEPAAVRDETILQLVADEDWACAVEHLIHKPAKASVDQGNNASCSEDVRLPQEHSYHEAHTESDFTEPTGVHVPWPTEYGDKILLLKLTRCGQKVQDALQREASLELVHAHASQAGHNCRLPSGASMYVYANQYSIIKSVLPESRLKPHHIVVAEAFLPFVVNAIKGLPSRSNVRVNSSSPLAIVEGEHANNICVVEKTFYNTLPREFRSQESVTQSTSDVHHVTNPRRSSPPFPGK